MSALGEVKVSLGLDTAKAQSQLKTFFQGFSQQQVSDPLKGLEASFAKVEAAAKRLGYSWDATKKAFTSSGGETKSIQQMADVLGMVGDKAAEAAGGQKTFSDATRAASGSVKGLPIVGLNKDLAGTASASGTASKGIQLISGASNTTAKSVTGLRVVTDGAQSSLVKLGQGGPSQILGISQAVDTTAGKVNTLGDAAVTAGGELSSIGANSNIENVGSSADGAKTKVGALKNEASSTDAVLDSIDGSGLKNIDASADGANASVKAINAILGTLTSTLKQVGPAGKGVDLARTYLGGLSKEAQSANVPVGTLNKLLGQQVGKPYDPARVSLTGLNTAAKAAKTDLDGLGKELGEAAVDADRFGDAIKVGFEQLLMGIPQGIGMSLGNMLMAPFRELANVIPAAVEEYRALDEILRLTLAISGANSDQFGELQAEVQRVGTAAAGTNAEVAAVAQSLSRAGFSIAQIGEALGPIVQGAEATGTAYDEMADYVSSALGQFGLAAEDAVDVVDTLVTGANSANQSVTDIGYALKYVGPVAAATGQSLQDVSIALEVLANNGIKGSTAGTSLRAILVNLQIAASGAGEEFTDLIKGSESLSGALSVVGADVTEANGELKSGTDLIYSLQDAMNGLSSGEKAIISKKLAGSDGLPAFNALLNATGESIEKLAAGMDGRAGAAAKSQEKAMAGLAGSFKFLEGNISVLLTSIGAFITVGLKPLIDGATLLLGAFNSLPGPIQNIAFVFASLVAAAAAVNAVMAIMKTQMIADFFVKAAAGVQVFTSAMSAGNIGATLTSWLTGLTSLGAQLMGSTVQGLNAATGALKVFNTSMSAGAIATAINGMVSSLGGFSQMLKSNLLGALKTASDAFKAWAASLSAATIQQAINSTLNATKGLGEGLVKLGSVLGSALSGGAKGAYTELGKLTTFITKLPSHFKTGADGVKKMQTALAASQLETRAMAQGLSGLLAPTSAVQKGMLASAAATTASGAAAAGSAGGFAANASAQAVVAGAAANATPWLAASGTAAAGSGVAAAGGAIGFGTLAASMGAFLVALAPIAAVVGVLAIAIGGLVKYMQGHSEMTKKLEGDTNKLNKVLEEGGDSAEKSGDGFKWWYDSMIGAMGPLGGLINAVPGLGVALKLLLGTIQVVAEGLGRLFGWFEERGKIDASKKEFENLSGAIEQASVSIASNRAEQEKHAKGSEEWNRLQTENIRIQEAVVTAQEDRLATLDAEINKLDESGKGNSDLAQQLRSQKEAIEGTLGPARERLNGLELELKVQDAISGTNTRVEQSWQAVEKARVAAFAAADTTKQVQELTIQSQVIAGLKTEAEARALTAKAAVESIDKQSAADEEALAKLTQLRDEAKISEEEYINKKQEITNRNKETIQARIDAEKELKEAVKEAINERLDAYAEEMNRIASNVNAIVSTLQELGSINVAGIGAFKQLADASTAYEMAGIDRVKDARLKMIDLTYKDGDAKESAKQQAEMSYENEKRKIQQDSQTFAEAAQRATYAAKLAELELWYVQQKITNEIAQVEASIAIEKAKASGASQQEIDSLNQVLELYKFQGVMVGEMVKLKREVIDIENQGAEAQLAAKARAEGTNTAFAGSVANVQALTGQMQNFGARTAELSEHARAFGNTLGQIATNEAPLIADKVRDEINRGLDEIDVTQATEALRGIGIPPEVAAAVSADLTKAVLSGAAAGAEGGKIKIVEAFKNQEYVPKQLITNALIVAMTQGGSMGVDAAKAEIAKLPEAMSFEAIATLLEKSIGDGTASGEELLNGLTLDTETVNKIKEAGRKGLEDGGTDGAKAFNKAVEDGTPKLETAVSEGVKGGLGKAEVAVGEWSDRVAPKIKQSLTEATGVMQTEFAIQIDLLAEQMGKAIAVLAEKFDSTRLAEKVRAGLKNPIEEAAGLLQNMVLPPGLADAGKVIEASFKGAVTAGLAKELKTIASSSGTAKTASDRMASNFRSLQSSTARTASNMERIANAAMKAARYKFAGGPVSPGQTYTVNEFGREMFMNNSGRLSEIKAPAFGNWTPPSSGTVVPAHIANQLRDGQANGKAMKSMQIPGNSGGTTIKLQQASQESGLQRSLVRELQRMGDAPGNVSNNITIQSTRPVNDASRMLAEMSRLKAHRRY